MPRFGVSVSGFRLPEDGCEKEIESLLYWSKRLAAKKILTGYEGNLSQKCADGSILVTRSFTDKENIQKKDLLWADLDGNILTNPSKNEDAKITSEFLLHKRIYEKDKTAAAVFHAHPPFGVILTLIGQKMEPPLLVETAAYFGKIPIAPFAMSGTAALPDSIDAFIPEYKGILLQNHGAVTYAGNAEEAGCKMEILEKSSMIYYYANRTGRDPQPLPEDAVEFLNNLRQ